MKRIIYTTKPGVRFYDENGNTIAIPLDSFKTLCTSFDDLTKAFNSASVSFEDITIPLIVSETKQEDLDEDPIDIREFLNT